MLVLENVTKKFLSKFFCAPRKCIDGLLGNPNHLKKKTNTMLLAFPRSNYNLSTSGCPVANLFKWKTDWEIIFI
jgi:hypothetical protein